MRRTAAGVVLWAVCLSAGNAAQIPTFRTSAEVVVVPVWVMQNNHHVAGLTAADFQLLDNGIPQEISSASVQAPVDVTLVLDTSGSVLGGMLQALKTGVRDVGLALRPDDRVRLLTFAASVTDSFGTRPGQTALPVDRIEAGGETSFYNALAAALMSAPATDRSQLIFGLSDGLDTQSFLNARDVLALAGSSGAALYLALRSQPLSYGRRDQPNLSRLREITERTGGLLFENPGTSAIATLFARAIEDFRASYLLSYRPQNVPRDGWHTIVVRTKNGRHNVRARQGYQGR